jgi:hypothetical protein
MTPRGKRRISATAPPPAAFACQEEHRRDRVAGADHRGPEQRLARPICACRRLLINDAARNITGMVPLTVTDTTDGRTIQIYNNGSFNITLKDQSGSSTAANRFDLNSAPTWCCCRKPRHAAL